MSVDIPIGTRVRRKPGKRKRTVGGSYGYTTALPHYNDRLEELCIAVHYVFSREDVDPKWAEATPVRELEIVEDRK